MYLIWNNGIHSMHEAVAAGHFIIQSTAAPVMSNDMSDMFDYNVGCICLTDQVIFTKKGSDPAAVFEGMEWALVPYHSGEAVRHATHNLGVPVQDFSSVGLLTEHQKALRRKAEGS